MGSEDAAALAAAHAVLLARAIRCTLDGRSRLTSRDAEVEMQVSNVRAIAVKQGLADV
jgi:glutamate-ammonia-ligase adenylyltransferase